MLKLYSKIMKIKTYIPDSFRNTCHRAGPRLPSNVAKSFRRVPNCERDDKRTEERIQGMSHHGIVPATYDVNLGVAFRLGGAITPSDRVVPIRAEVLLDEGTSKWAIVPGALAVAPSSQSVLVFRGVENRIEADANERRLTGGGGTLCASRATEGRSEGGRHEVVNIKRIVY